MCYPSCEREGMYLLLSIDTKEISKTVPEVNKSGYLAGMDGNAME